ncbi:hypothetical protein A0H81_11001 [Grifola frondosa]|uniref:T6SS Phospholipase effector Tle1-like catalytic domain-containing protein n=1 Tax=Grifola frondosa TaxID=5627 RepID=A0A1C7LW10_GRIFR|nr:hypothetical protein A0H81_11001 [Grifola frondosa]
MSVPTFCECPHAPNNSNGNPNGPQSSGQKDGAASVPPSASEQNGRNLNTNIVELYSQLVKDKTQLTYYNSGIGTYAKPSRKAFGHWKRVLDNKIDLAIAWNFDRIVKGAYRWLAENYQDGDVIYLFGFSRGAYQVRALAAMIYKVGLIHKGNEEQIAYAYALYADPNSGDPFKEMANPEDQGNAPIAEETQRRSSVFRKLKKMIPRDASAEMQCPAQAKGAESVQKESQKRLTMAERFKQTFSRKGVQVHVVGAWDTVSSIGLFRDKNLPGTDYPPTACYFRHALALDERRVKFLPEYACGGTTFVDGRKPVQDPRERDRDSLRKESKTEASQRVKEVWFSGTHSDIGGGNIDNEDLNRRHPSSLWMFYEAISMGLKLEPAYVEWEWDDLGDVKESLTSIWKFMEYLPIKRLSYDGIDARAEVSNEDKRSTSLWPFALAESRGREDHMYWTKALEDLLELDIFDPKAASTLVDKLEGSSDHNSDLPFWIHRLNIMVGSYEGCRSLRTVSDVLGRLLRFIKPKWEATWQAVVLNAVRTLADGVWDVRNLLEQSADLPEILNNLLKNSPQDSDEGHLKTVAVFVAKFYEVDWCEDFFENRVIPAMSRLLEGSAKQSEWAEILVAIHNDIKDHDFIWERLLLIPRLFDNVSSIMLSSSEPSMCLTGLSFMHYVARHGKYDAILDVNFITGPLTNTRRQVRLECLEVVGLFIQDRRVRCDMLEKGLEMKLLDRLSNGDTVVCRPSCRVLGELIGFSIADGTIDKILNATLWTALSAMLKDDTSNVRTAGLVLIEECSQHDVFRQAMVANEVPIKALLTHKDFARWSYLKTIALLVRYGDTRSFMLKENLMLILLETLRDDSWETREQSLRVIRELIKSSSAEEEIHSQILASEFWATLLNTLNDRDRDVRTACLDAIEECRKRGKILRSRFKVEGISLTWNTGLDIFCSAMVAQTTPITALLTQKDSEYGYRLKAIGVFVRDGDIRSIMMKNNLLDMLGNMLRDDVKHLRASSLDIIRELIKSSSVNEGIIDQVLDTDFWVTVLNMSNDSDSDVHESYANLFEEFSDNGKIYPVFCDAMVAKMTPITALLNREDSDISCCLTEIRFFVKDRRIRTILVQNNLIAILQDTLRHDDWGVRKSSLEVVQELLRSSTTEEGIHDQILNSALWTSLLDVLNVIKESSKQDVFCREMVANGELLIREELKDYDVLNTIKILVRERNMRSYMVENDLIAILCNVLRDDDWESQVSGVEVMQELVKSSSDSEDIRDRILDGPVWTSVLKVLDDEDSVVPRPSVDLIRECSKYESFCRAMVTNATPIIELLEGSHSYGRLESIALLLRDRNIRACMVKNNLITILRDTLRDGPWNVPALRLDVIRDLIHSSSADEGVHDRILASSIWTSLPNVLRDDDDDVRKACLSLIEECSKHDSFRRAMVTVNNGRSTALKKLNLPKLLRDRYDEARKGGVTPVVFRLIDEVADSAHVDDRDDRSAGDPATSPESSTVDSEVVVDVPTST